jgi:hypothetical protein
VSTKRACEGVILALTVGAKEKKKRMWMKEWFKKRHKLDSAIKLTQVCLHSIFQTRSVFPQSCADLQYRSYTVNHNFGNPILCNSYCTCRGPFRTVREFRQQTGLVNKKRLLYWQLYREVCGGGKQSGRAVTVLICMVQICRGHRLASLRF